ncbi:MAG: hypothetical protein ACI4TK_03790 [Agathobacter sp.]
MNIAREFSLSKANKESAIYRACIRMAKEQQENDIERAVLWLKFRSEYPFCGEIIEGFRKYMEEQL